MGIWIYGGTVNAAGGDCAAGIGAGEDSGNMRKEEDGGGINILGGNVTAEGGENGAGIGGGKDANVSGTIAIKGENTVVYAVGGNRGAGIGAGGPGAFPDNGNMKATITIDCGENSSINAYGFDKDIIDKHPDDYVDYVYDHYHGGAGIGAGHGGNMEGTVIIKGGNVNVWGGLNAAGIGGGRENGGYGGEGGDVYIGGGNIKITLLRQFEFKNEAIGAGHEDSKSGSVYIDKSNNDTGKYMRVIYHHLKEFTTVDWTKTAAAGERSKRCHQAAHLEICECPHTDHEGNSGLTYTYIDENKHKEKCKFCGYEGVVEHKGDTCGYGYEKPRYTVTLKSKAGISQAIVAVSFRRE